MVILVVYGPCFGRGDGKGRGLRGTAAGGHGSEEGEEGWLGVQQLLGEEWRNWLVLVSEGEKGSHEGEPQILAHSGWPGMSGSHLM